MGYSTSDAERIARLEAATRAARKIVEEAKAEDGAFVENRWNDRSRKDTDRAPNRQPPINHPDP
jgi:hypothetical protein